MNTYTTFTLDEPINGINISVIKAGDDLYFYARDIGEALGLVSARNTIARFASSDTLSIEKRRQFKINTYKIHKGKRVRDDKIILLTESGMYKLISIARTESSQKVQNFMYRKLRELHYAEIYRLRAQVAKLQGNLTAALNIPAQPNVIENIPIAQPNIQMLCVFKVEYAIIGLIPRGDINSDYDAIIGRPVYKYTTLIDTYNDLPSNIYCTGFAHIGNVFAELDSSNTISVSDNLRNSTRYSTITPENIAALSSTNLNYRHKL
jgi:hypothetical protein